MRKRQFAQIKPTTRTDLAIAWPGMAATDWLFEVKNRGSARITHVVGLGSLAAIHAKVQAWLQAAYRADAPRTSPAKHRAPSGRPPKGPAA